VFIEKKNKVMEFRGGDVHVEEGCYPFRQTKVKEPSWKLDEEREEQDNRVEEERLVWSEVQPGQVEERKEVFQDDDDVIHAEHAFEPQDSVSAHAAAEPEPAKPERASVPEHPPLSSEIQIAKRYRFVDNSPPRVEAQEWTHRRQSVRIATQRSKAESTRLPRSPLRDRDRDRGGGGGGRGRGRITKMVGSLTPEDVVVPRTFAQAMKSPQAEEWKMAMEAELANMQRSQVWEIVSDIVAIGSRWVTR